MKGCLVVGLSVMAMTPALAQDPGLSPKLQPFSWSIGTWKASGNIEFGGKKTPIESEMTVSVDGEFLKIVSADKSGGYTLTKTCMTGWDPEKKEYTSYTFTNMASTARIGHGQYATDKLVMTSDPWKAEGMTSIVRETFSKLPNGGFRLLMEFKAGDKWLTGLKLDYMKK